MRKRLKRKACCCALCKPFKRGKANRWKTRELDRLVRDEKEIQAFQYRPSEDENSGGGWK